MSYYELFKKKVLPILLACIVVLLAAVPQISVFAEKGTLGTENPVWKASFLDSDGNAADGNSLIAGEYTVNLNLYGMKTVSVLQISATYTDAVTVNSCKTIAQSKSALFRDIIKKKMIMNSTPLLPHTTAIPLLQPLILQMAKQWCHLI